MTRQIIGVLFLSIVLNGHSLSQTGVNNSGASGSQFLNIGVGARAMGIGGAFTAMANDGTAMYWNPAGLSRVDRIQVALVHTQWAADITHEFASIAFPLSEQFTAGLGVILLNSGDIEITTIDQPRGTGQMYSTKDLAIMATLGWDVTQELSVGATLKYIRNSIYTLAATGIAFDVGTQFNTQFHGLRVALSVSNLGAKQTFSGNGLEFQQSPPYPGAQTIRASYYNTPFSLPLLYRAGVAIDLLEAFESQGSIHALTFAADIAQATDNPEKFHLGVEYGWEQTLFLRGGYILNAAELGLNLGLGVQWQTSSWKLIVDYAYADLGRFSAGHRIGLSFEI